MRAKADRDEALRMEDSGRGSLGDFCLTGIAETRCGGETAGPLLSTEFQVTLHGAEVVRHEPQALAAVRFPFSVKAGS